MCQCPLPPVVWLRFLCVSKDAECDDHSRNNARRLLSSAYEKGQSKWFLRLCLLCGLLHRWCWFKRRKVYFFVWFTSAGFCLDNQTNVLKNAPPNFTSVVKIHLKNLQEFLCFCWNKYLHLVCFSSSLRFAVSFAKTRF